MTDTLDPRDSAVKLVTGGVLGAFTRSNSVAKIVSEGRFLIVISIQKKPTLNAMCTKVGRFFYERSYMRSNIVRENWTDNTASFLCGYFQGVARLESV